jgi:hypothetical protein
MYAKIFLILGEDLELSVKLTIFIIVGLLTEKRRLSPRGYYQHGLRVWVLQVEVVSNRNEAYLLQKRSMNIK